MKDISYFIVVSNCGCGSALGLKYSQNAQWTVLRRKMVEVLRDRNFFNRVNG